MRVALITSNLLSLKKDTKKGTEIIAYNLIHEFSKHYTNDSFELTVFAAGNSDIPVKIESVDYEPTSNNLYVMRAGKHIIYELALISKAFSMQDQFDLYHIHLGDGDIALPFAPFIDKPILVTLYHPADPKYAKSYTSLFNNCKNIFYIAPTQGQKEHLPDLRYVDVIPHGIDAEQDFKYDQKGGDSMMWAGRAVPQKGADIALQIANQTHKPLRLFGITKDEHKVWFEENIVRVIKDNDSLTLNRDRLDLAKEYQNSKLFLFPLQWEEPFGLVLVESMSCGTPVVTYAKGAIPEIIEDGVTGFIVNESEEDFRGDWIIKKTGKEGLIEAVERIYSMPQEEYLAMREACRSRVEMYYTIEKMAENYINSYKKILQKKD